MLKISLGLCFSMVAECIECRCQDLEIQVFETVAKLVCKGCGLETNMSTEVEKWKPAFHYYMHCQKSRFIKDDKVFDELIKFEEKKEEIKKMIRDGKDCTEKLKKLINERKGQ